MRLLSDAAVATERPTGRIGARSPFLTANAAARMLGVPPRAMLRRLSLDTAPGYRLGRRWFIPHAELEAHAHPGRSVQAVTIVDVVRDLVDPLPLTLDVEDLEAFFGTRRPQLYEILRFPSLGGRTATGRVTTSAVVAAALIQARNGCEPVRAVPLPH